MGNHSGRPVQQGLPRRARARSGAGRAGQSGADLGPPQYGESDVCFHGKSESAMQADVLAALLQQLEMTPAVIAGGSGGSRVSLLTAARHPEVAAGWPCGGSAAASMG